MTRSRLPWLAPAAALFGLAALTHAQGQPALEKVVPLPPIAKKAEPKPPDPEPAFDQHAEDLRVLKEAGLVGETADLAKFLDQRTPSPDDASRLAALIRQFSDESYEARETASREVIGFGFRAVTSLRAAEGSPDSEVARRAGRALEVVEKVPLRTITPAAVRVLGRAKSPAALAALLKFAPQAEDASGLDEIAAALGRLIRDLGKTDPALLAALDDADPKRRAAASEAAAGSADLELRSKMRERLRAERDPETRLRILVALVAQARVKEVLPEMIRALADAPSAVRWRGEELLWRLAGEAAPDASFGRDPDLDKKAVAAWLAWHDKVAPKLDLAALDRPDVFLGLTVVMETDGNGINGRIRELTPDKTVRAKLEGLIYPMDCAFLPGGRILVAEHNAQPGRVTERDFRTGKELWSIQIDQPHTAKALRSGNLLVASRNKLVELTADHKEVLSIQRPNHDLVAASREPNGDLWILTQLNNSGQLSKIDKEGKVLRAVNLPGMPNYMGNFQMLPGNRVLYTQMNQVVEVDLESGKVVGKPIPVAYPTFVQRLPNGRTLVTSQNSRKVSEYDRDNKEVWSYSPEPNFLVFRAFRR